MDKQNNIPNLRQEREWEKEKLYIQYCLPKEIENKGKAERLRQKFEYGFHLFVGITGGILLASTIELISKSIENKKEEKKLRILEIEQEKKDAELLKRIEESECIDDIAPKKK